MQNARQPALVPPFFDKVEAFLLESMRERRDKTKARRRTASSEPRKKLRAQEKKKTAEEKFDASSPSPRERLRRTNCPLATLSPPRLRTCARLLAAPQSPRPAAASCSTAETRLQSRPCAASARRNTSCSVGVHGARGRECELELGSSGGPRAPSSASEVETSGSMGLSSWSRGGRRCLEGSFFSLSCFAFDFAVWWPDFLSLDPRKPTLDFQKEIWLLFCCE